MKKGGMQVRMNQWSKLYFHSMARANLKKSKHFSTSTTTVHTQEAQNLHQLKSPFQIQLYLVNVPLNVNIVKQDLFNKK